MKTSKSIDFVGNRKIFFIFSSVLILAITLFSVTFGVKLDIQFTGGAMLTYSYQGDLDASALEKTVQKTLGSNCAVQYGD